MLDLVIKGGQIIDGTGAARRRADVGINGARIVEIGEINAEAARTIDATGKLVTPGFIDVHTHFDAQVFWDSALTPSPLHGVTTAIAGNCGFTIAPLSDRPDDGDYLMRMLARVEGMPIDTLRSGVPWNWRSTAEYFERVEGTIGINLGFMVGHSSIRRIAMGPDASHREATPDELETIKLELRAGLEAGGLGFSSSYARTHNDADGNMVPSRNGSLDELVELARVTGEFVGTGLEIIPQVGPRFDQWAVDLMADMSIAAQRPINWNVLLANHANLDECLGKLEASDYARAKGGKVVALTMPISFGARLSFAGGFVLDVIPGWEAPMMSSRDEKLALLRDKAARESLNAMAQAPGNPFPIVADWASKTIYDVVAPENEQYRGRTVGAIASELGREPFDVLCDIVVADELNTSFGYPAPPETDADWKARLSLWRDRRTVIGASDAGAHYDLLATFNYTTGMLQGAVRERGLLSFEEAVRLLTQVPAELYGIRERGLLREGWYADVDVIDPATIGTDDVAMRFDLPGGAGRLYAESTGVEHVFVNGSPIVTNGVLTENRAGTLLRSGRDTATPSLS
jgi:N-acyl-D-aspartate/D-glutamate deacylase